MLLLPAKIDHAVASAGQSDGYVGTKSWLAQAQKANWQLDASALQDFDSSALALLLDLRRGAIAANTALTIHNPSSRLTQLAALYGVNELIA